MSCRSCGTGASAVYPHLGLRREGEREEDEPRPSRACRRPSRRSARANAGSARLMLAAQRRKTHGVDDAEQDAQHLARARYSQRLEDDEQAMALEEVGPRVLRVLEEAGLSPRSRQSADSPTSQRARRTPEGKEDTRAAAPRPSPRRCPRLARARRRRRGRLRARTAARAGPARGPPRCTRTRPGRRSRPRQRRTPRRRRRRRGRVRRGRPRRSLRRPAVWGSRKGVVSSAPGERRAKRSTTHPRATRQARVELEALVPFCDRERHVSWRRTTRKTIEADDARVSPLAAAPPVPNPPPPPKKTSS